MKQETRGRKKGEPKKALGVRVPLKDFAYYTNLVREQMKRRSNILK